MDGSDAHRVSWLAALAAVGLAFGLTAADAAAPAPRAQAGLADPVPLVVVFRGETTQAAAFALARSAGARPLRWLGVLDAVAVSVARERRVAAERLLRASPLVDVVEPDPLVSEPEDPEIFATDAPASAHSATRASHVSSRPTCSLTAVLDSGIDWTHPALKGRIWSNKGERAGNGVDDDDNGYVDDYHGYDVRARSGSGMDRNGHGTHVAGILAARPGVRDDVTGLCAKAQLMSVRIMGGDARGRESDAAAGIVYAVNAGAKVVNASFVAARQAKVLGRALDLARRRNVIIVAAAGNNHQDIDDKPAYPAASARPNILAVASTNRADSALASYSNYGGRRVELAASGTDVISTWRDGGYRWASGTSMAAPMAAAAAAALRHRGGLSTTEIIARLSKTVRRLSSLRNRTSSGGTLDFDRALGH